MPISPEPKQPYESFLGVVEYTSELFLYDGYFCLSFIKAVQVMARKLLSTDTEQSYRCNAEPIGDGAYLAVQRAFNNVVETYAISMPMCCGTSGGSKRS